MPGPSAPMAVREQEGEAPAADGPEAVADEAGAASASTSPAPDTSGRWLDRLGRLDLSRGKAWWILATSVVLTRLPLLGLGFGRDPDTWRIANTLLNLWNDQTYIASRGTGHPTVEFAMTPFIWGGWWATNTLTLLVSLLGIWCFARILERLAVPHQGWLVLTCAFFPIVWVHSANSHDFMWGLSILLCAWWLVLEERLHVGAVVLGLAAGARVTGVFFGPVFAWMIWRRDRQWRPVLIYTVVSSGVTLLLHTPSFLAKGLLGWTEAYGNQTVSTRDGLLRFVDAYGKLAVVAGLVALLMAVPAIVRQARGSRATGDDGAGEVALAAARTQRSTRDALLMAAGSLPVVLFYLGSPYKPEYLLALLPPLLILLATSSQRHVLLAVLVLMLSKDVASVNLTAVLDPFDEEKPLFEAGLIWDRASQRADQVEQSRWVGETSEGLNRSVVIAGWYSTEAMWFLGGSPEHEHLHLMPQDVHIHSLVSETELLAYQEDGYAVYHSSVAQEFSELWFGFDPAVHGSLPLDQAPGATAPP